MFQCIIVADSDETPPPQSQCDCVIEKLLRSPFSSLKFAEQLKIIEAGPPRPTLTIRQQQKSHVRNFHENLYNEDWMCGCLSANKFFCWPCVLFSTKKESVWGRLGFENLKDIHRAQETHANSVNHILCSKQLHLFGKNRIESAFDTEVGQSIERHNAIVKTNRKILGHLLQITCHLGKLGLPFRDHFVEFVNEVARSNNWFKTNVEGSSAFCDLSPGIQDDLVASVGEVMIDTIKSEISKTSFVALSLDEAADGTMNSNRFSLSFRYVSEAGKIAERFVQFIDLHPDRKAEAVLADILEILEDFNCGNKLIAQSCDGAVMPAEQLNQFQTLLREHYKSATFLQCTAHRLNSVLAQSVSFIKKVKPFFHNLSGFSAFFTAKRTEALDNFVKNRNPSAAPKKWNFQSRIVKTINDHKANMEAFFETIVKNEDEEWDRESSLCARGLLSLLRDFDFNFFLTVFALIFPESESIFKLSQVNSLNVDCCKKKMNGFIDQVETMRKQFNIIWEAMDEILDDQPINKRMRLDQKNSYFRLYNEVFDIIILNVNQRFSEIFAFKFLNLFAEYQSSTKSFPKQSYSSLLENFSDFFNTFRLKNELCVIHTDPDMNKDNALELHQYITSVQLSSIFPELSKLTRLILTIPATSNSAENSVSCLKRIRTYLRKSQSQERLSALALMNIESAFLDDLRSTSAFEEAVIQVFAKRNESVDLNLK